MNEKISTILESVKKLPEIKLLSNQSIIQWILGDLSFLEERSKVSEDNWGRSMLKIINPAFNKTEWSGPLGQHIAMEMLLLAGYKNPRKPKRLNKVEPDLETDEYVWEIKNGTYLTSGTAHEKILGVPMKYSEVPIWFEKPLIILCMGRAEKMLREYYLDNPKPGTNRQKILQLYHSMNIRYMSASSLLET